MVAERSINQKRFLFIKTEEIRIENVDISNDKQCDKTLSPKVLGFQNKVNPFW